MVGIYCRISSKKEDDRDTSIDTQIEEGVTFANIINEEYRIYKDIGISGKAEIEDRDDFNLFIKDIQKGKINHIFAINQSRIERSPKTWQIFVASVLNSGAKWYPDGKLFDLDNTTNRLLANMMSIINEFHSDNTSDAVKKAFKSNALKGKSHGKLGYGHRRDDEGYIAINEEEAKIVREIFDWSLNGVGSYTIANKLNDLGVSTKHQNINSKSNNKWYNSTVLGILKNTNHKGIYNWNDEVIPLPNIAIIQEDKFDNVQINLGKNKKNNIGKNATYRYLLNGLLICVECGKEYRGKRRLKGRDNAYKCTGKQAPLYVCKNSRGFNIPKFETFLINHLFLKKGLKDFLNTIEVDNDEIEVLLLKLKHLNTTISSIEKKVTRAYNLMFDSELSDDERVKKDYIASKSKLLKLNQELIVCNQIIQERTNNNRLNKVNKVIDGFAINHGFEVIKKAILQIIERIEIEYHPLEKNGVYRFTIKYKGFNETIKFLTNQQLTNFACVNYKKEYEDSELGTSIIEEYSTPRGLLRFKLAGIIKSDLDIQIKQSELIIFDS